MKLVQQIRTKIGGYIVRSLGLGIDSFGVGYKDATLPQPINVNSTEKAMTLSAAYRCTAILSGTIASLPLQIKRRCNGVYRVDERHELFHLLTLKPNRRMNSFEFIHSAIVQTVNRGNAFIYIKRSIGEISYLILLSNGSVNYDKYTDTYTVSDVINNIHGVFYSDDIIHLKNNSLDGGYTGASVVEWGSRALSVAASADNQSLKTFQNGSKIKGIISGVKNVGKGISSLTDVQITDVSDRVEEQLNSGKDIAAIPEDMQFTQLSITPADAQLLETKKFSVLDICRFYGVNPDKAFAGQPTNYKASEMNQINFLTDTLQPLLKQIEIEFKTKLIPRVVWNDYKIEFDLSVLYQTDLMTQASYWKTLLEIGGITPNEIRKERGVSPLNGGDETFITCNVAPVNSAKIRGESTKEETEQPNADEIKPPK